MRARLKDVFKFARPVTPGYGISSGFYLAVLASKAVLPTIRQVIDPKGEGDAVTGFGVPLAKGSTKDDLFKPMQRGTYALAAPDQKTVLRAVVLPKEEAGFDAAQILGTALGESLPDEARKRLAATWWNIQLTFESHHPAVDPAVGFIYSVADRVATLTEGVIADAGCRRYLLPQGMPWSDGAARAVEVGSRLTGGCYHAFTLGMAKFGLPEFEMTGVGARHVSTAEAVLRGAVQSRFGGTDMAPGSIVGGGKAAFQVAPGGLEAAFWGGAAVYEFLPVVGTIDDSLSEVK